MAPPTPTAAKAAILNYLTTVIQIALTGATVDLSDTTSAIDTWITTYSPEIHDLPDYSTNILPSMAQSIYQSLITHCSNVPFTIPGMAKFLDVLPAVDTINWLQPTLQAMIAGNTFTNPVNGIIYVSSSAGSDTSGSGSSDNPFASINHALSIITNSQYQVIQVAGGTYVEGTITLSDKNISIVGENPQDIQNSSLQLPVQIAGQFVLTSSAENINVTLKNLGIAANPGENFLNIGDTTCKYDINLTFENIQVQGSAQTADFLANYRGTTIFRKLNYPLVNTDSVIITQVGNVYSTGATIIFEDSILDQFVVEDTTQLVSLEFKRTRFNTVNLASCTFCEVYDCIFTGAGWSFAWVDTFDVLSGDVNWHNCEFRGDISHTGTTGSYGMFACKRKVTSDELDNNQNGGVILDDVISTRGVKPAGVNQGFALMQNNLTANSGDLYLGYDNAYNLLYSSVKAGGYNLISTIGLATGDNQAQTPVIIGNIGTVSTATNALEVYYNGASVAQINGTTGAYTPPSDVKLKTNLKAKKPRKDLKNLKKICNLPVTRYSMKTDKQGHQILGFIAQDLETILKRGIDKKPIVKDGKKVFPTYQENEIRRVDINEIVAAFVLGFQEYVYKCDQEIQNLKDEISLLVRKDQQTIITEQKDVKT